LGCTCDMDHSLIDDVSVTSSKALESSPFHSGRKLGDPRLHLGVCLSQNMCACACACVSVCVSVGVCVFGAKKSQKSVLWLPN